MTRRTLSSANGPTLYTVAGEGPPVVLLHGATMDHRMWGAQVAGLSASFRLIIPDLPGHGGSRPVASFSLRRCAEEVARILDEEELASAHLVGQSMGGYVAQILAFERPGRVRSLVAVDSSPLDASYYSRWDRWLLSITPALLALYPSERLVRAIAGGIATTEEGRQLALRILQDMSKAEIATIMGAVYEGVMDSADRGLSLQCPALIVYGEEDTTGKVIRYSKRWAREAKLPVHVVPGAGHNSNVDNPADVNAALETFLARVEAGEGDR